MADQLHIQLLGAPALSYHGESWTLQRREVRAMLFYLAARNAPVTRSQLLVLLWPDGGPDKVLKRLRETLAHLKAGLPLAEMLCTNKEQVWLDPQLVSCDAAEFTRMADETAQSLAKLPPNTFLPEPLYQRLAHMVNLWRTLHFLDGMNTPDSSEFELWHEEMDTTLRRQRQTRLERLAEHDLQLGNLAQAEVWLNKAIEIDPSNDLLHLNKLTLYERGGRAQAALAYLRQLRKQYESDGFDELPEALRQAEKRLVKLATRAEDLRPPLWNGRRLFQVPFVGRKMELEALQAAYRRGGVTLLLGEAGSGKTRLVQELHNSLEPAPRLLVMASRPLETDLPFQAFIDFFRAQVPVDEWRDLPRSWLAVMALLLPELNETFDDLPRQPAPLALAQPVLFEALLQSLRLLKRNQRVLLFFDDVQWSDETSLKALSYLCEHGFFDQNAAMVLACRVEVQPQALRHLAGVLRMRGMLQEIRLQPLPSGDVAELSRAILGRGLPDELVDRIAQSTGGNPLFLLESLRALEETHPNLEQLARQAALPVSVSMAAVIHQRREQLSADAQLVLTLAAVAGSAVDLSLLEEICQLKPERLAAALEELENARLLIPGDRQGAFQFAHDSVRDITLAELSPARRRMYHLRVGEALKKRAGAGTGAHAGLLALHYQEAGEWQPAFQAWLQAARYARTLYSYAEAFSGFHKAYELYQKLEPELTEDDLYRFLTGWLELAYSFGDAAMMQKITQECLAVGYRRKSPRLIAFGFLGKTSEADLTENVMEGHLALDEGLPFIQQTGDNFLMVRYHYHRGGFLMIDSRCEEAIHELEQGLALIPERDHPGLKERAANLSIRLTLAYLLNGNPARAYQEAESVLAMSRQIFNQTNTVRGLLVLGLTEMYGGRYRKALEHAMMALDLLAPEGSDRLRAMVMNLIAETSVALGHLDDTWDYTGRSLDVCARASYPRVKADALRIRGDMLRFFGRLPDAEEHYRQAYATSPGSYTGVQNLYRLGHFYALTGREEEGRRMLAQAGEICRAGGLVLFRLSVDTANCRLLWGAGKYAEATELASAVAEESHRREIYQPRIHAYINLIYMALRMERYDEVSQKALAVVRLTREAGNTPQELSALDMVIEALRKQGRDSRVHEERRAELIQAILEKSRSPDMRSLVEEYRARVKV